MKTTNLFDLGYFDLFKALFFGKKIHLGVTGGFSGSTKTLDTANIFRSNAAAEAEDVHFEAASPFPETDWNPGKMWTDSYHVNPFNENPFERM